MRIVTLVLFCVVLTNSCGYMSGRVGNRAHFGYLKKNIEKTECDNNNRLSAAEQLLSETGLKTEIKEYEEGANVVVFLEGKSDDYIVVGAHYDKTTLGCGAIDNWSGIAMLSLLAREFDRSGRIKSYKFVAFGGEEQDLQGSRAMAEAIRANAKSKPCAMVNLDSFGFERAWGLESISDREMLMLAADVERERGGSFSIRNYRGASSDSKSFRRIGVPSITFSGLDDDWRDYLHQDADQVKNVDFEMVADNYEFIRAFVEKLDSTPCDRLKGKE